MGRGVATTSIPSITYKPPIVISSLLDDAGVERTPVPEPSAVGTIIGGDAGLAFTTGLPEISLVGVSLGCAPLRSLRSCGPNSICESICSFWRFSVGIGAAGPDDEDAGSCCAAGAGSWDSVAGSVISPTGASTGSALSSDQCLFQSHATCSCIWSQTDTATAARRCTMPCYDLCRQVHTSMSRWALVLLRHNRRFQVFRPAIPRKSSHFLLLKRSRIFLQVARGATISISGPHFP